MQRLDPKVLFLFFLKRLVGSVYVLPIWFLAVFVFDQIWISSVGGLPESLFVLLLNGAGCIFFALLILVSYYWSVQHYLHFTYELAPDGLHIYNGIIIRRQVLIQYADIEKVDLLVNPFVVRFLNLYSLAITTRERANTEGILQPKQTYVIPGLTAEIARYLRPELLKDSHILRTKKYQGNRFF